MQDVPSTLFPSDFKDHLVQEILRYTTQAKPESRILTSLTDELNDISFQQEDESLDTIASFFKKDGPNVIPKVHKSPSLDHSGCSSLKVERKPFLSFQISNRSTEGSNPIAADKLKKFYADPKLFMFKHQASEILNHQEGSSVKN